MVLERLRAAGVESRAVAQALFDAYLSGLDNGLRELAVGDLSVGKTMRRLGEAFYGRGKALDEALAALPDRAPLEALIRRTVFAGVEPADPAPLTDYVLAARDELARAPAEALIEGKIDWRPAG
jgi:cytochrome b pre-mRNA-processing protein 3